MHQETACDDRSTTEAFKYNPLNGREEPRPDITRQNVALVDIDDLWFHLGKWGRYQVFQLCVLLVSGLPVSFAILNGVFIGKHVEHRCRNENVSVIDSYLLGDEGYVNESINIYRNDLIELTQCFVRTLKNTTEGLTVVSERKCLEYDYTEDVPSSSYISEWNLVCDNDALSHLPQTMTMVGMMVGASTLPHIGDRYGRRVLCVGSHIMLMCVMIAIAFVPVFEIFVVLKFVSGALNQGMMIPSNILLVELFPTESRSTIGFLWTAQWVVSVCILSPIAYLMRGAGWRYLMLVYGLVSVVSLLALWLLDESMRWLLANKEIERAKKIILKACRMNNKNYHTLMDMILNKNKRSKLPIPSPVESEFPLIELPYDVTPEVACAKGKTNATLLDIMKNPTLRKMSLIICYGWMVNAMTYYGLTLLSTTLAGDPYVNFILSGAVEFPSAIVMYYMIKNPRLGRKLTLMILLGSGGGFLLASVLIATFSEKTDVTATLQTVLTLAGKFCVTGSFNGIWIYTPELYPTNIRNAGIGFSSMSARLAASLTPVLTVLARRVLWAPGALFSASCFLCVFLLSLLPETVHRELPATIDEVESWCLSSKANKQAQNKQYDLKAKQTA